MSQPQLVLAPHEIAPHRRADWNGEPFSFRADWCGYEREFVGQVVGQTHQQMIFFALADEPERGNFVGAPIIVSGKDKIRQPIFEPRTYFNPKEAKSIIEKSTREAWGRIYYLDKELALTTGSESKEWRLFLAQSGWGQWYEYSGSQAFFRWNPNSDQARQMALVHPLELWNRTQESFLDERGDAALAREFATVDSKGRNRLCRPLTRGTYDEWGQVLGWYLCSYFPFDSTERRQFVIAILQHKDLRQEGWRVGSTLHPFGDAASQFCDWTRHYFGPQIDEDYLQRCSAAAHWINSSFYLRVFAKPPTHHERLEALLQLRDWLINKAAPAQIEAMLRDD